MPGMLERIVSEDMGSGQDMMAALRALRSLSLRRDVGVTRSMDVGDIEGMPSGVLALASGAVAMLSARGATGLDGGDIRGVLENRVIGGVERISARSAMRA